MLEKVNTVVQSMKVHSLEEQKDPGQATNKKEHQGVIHI